MLLKVVDKVMKILGLLMMVGGVVVAVWSGFLKPLVYLPIFIGGAGFIVTWYVFAEDLAKKKEKMEAARADSERAALNRRLEDMNFLRASVADLEWAIEQIRKCPGVPALINQLYDMKKYVDNMKDAERGDNSIEPFVKSFCDGYDEMVRNLVPVLSAHRINGSKSMIFAETVKQVEAKNEGQLDLAEKNFEDVSKWIAQKMHRGDTPEGMSAMKILRSLIDSLNNGGMEK